MKRRNNHIVERVVRESLRSHRFSKVVATVSGGADSVALLSVLSGCRGLRLLVAHCNFHLRGEESMRDQRVVESLCRNLGVELLVRDFDVDGYISGRRGVSVEMACRELRYEWFRSLMREHGADRIATGHNADDNIETLFLNLMRGSGTSGLKGMTDDTGEVWRPMLAVHRRDIVAYLEERGIGYITDSTNLVSDYRRNFIRNEVLPLLRTRWLGLDTALDRTLRHLREESLVVAYAVEGVLPEEGEPLTRERVLSFPSPELLVRRFIENAGPFTTTAGEVVAAMRADKSDVRRWRLSAGTLELRGGRLYVMPDA
ncbi:MAG: tRNA lysidine(34) synthetase TilS [Muribaculaceae bacterium]|nr:tRNA lysidine(34) synthetase TilS [Muribaculaceae bacterium]